MFARLYSIPRNGWVIGWLIGTIFSESDISLFDEKNILFIEL